MSYNIRTPMSVVVGMTELARLYVDEEERIRDYLEKIASSGAHLLSLTNEVLDVSKIESGAVELVERKLDLRSLVMSAVEIVRIPMDNRYQTPSIHIDKELYSHVTGDKMRLKQVLVNTLENASKYTGENGRISISLNEIKSLDQHAGTYRFVIEDTGSGMKPEYLKHIFESFSRADDSRTSKIPGTGLGMTIVKNIISMMGGEISAEGEYGKGL